MRGYYRAPDLTAKAIDADGWFNTGDLARFDGDCLYIVGRTKEMIIRSGFNVYPAEIEAVLATHDAVVQCAVVGRAVEGNEEVVAFVQLLQGSTTSAEELMAHVAPQLTSYKRPSEIIVLDSAAGDVDRKDTQAQTGGDAARELNRLATGFNRLSSRRRSLEKRNATVAVIGAGDFIGGEIAKKFASEGFTVFAGRRQRRQAGAAGEGDRGCRRRDVHARSLDARKEEEITTFLDDADKHAPLEVCIFNIGANVNFPILDTTERVFRKVWEMACYSGFLAGREAARLMLPRGKGNIFFTGATASLRGGSGLCRLCQRQIRAARGGTVDGARAWARRTSMSRISSSIPASIPNGCGSAGIEALGPECARQSRPA